MVHRGNTSPKSPTDARYWKPWPCEAVEQRLGADLAFYRPGPVASCEPACPEYAILMAVSNAREIVRISTLRTLRHCAGQSARLFVVDNASTDGAGEWLAALHARGEIDLVHNATNLEHGPALELARRATRSPYLVTLDSDAFPLSDNWLRELRALLDGGAKAAGIRHHRDYIHPSCLMVARTTLDEFGLTFLNEKDRPSQLDVAERISCEIKRRGFRIAGLERTADLGRGSISEPVYLGAEYGGIVYHQWYTTRSALAGGGAVDDVPQAALDRSLRKLIERDHTEPREVAVILGVRGRVGDADRIRNAQACLRALNLQDLPRWRYRIILVEQDDTPRLERLLAPLADRYLFIRNPGPYNRGWAFNVGAVHAAARALCLIDSDLLVAPDFLRRGLAALGQGSRALLPFTEVLYLDAPSTARAIAGHPGVPQGQLFTTSQGGSMWVEAALYQELGGHDERFRGWGREDREFWNRVSRATRITVLPGRMLHLDHPRPPMEDE
ncbi:MAG TPA: glycosyltransferase, partial [Bryobacteraceae bacterium]|nr:glycosyltransferase [Bryobacteraceae bacterium]